MNHSYSIFFQSQKDLTDDIDKAYNLFVDEEKGLITFASLKREVEDLISEELGDY